MIKEHHEHKITIEEVEDAINEVYLLIDPGIIRIILATVLANRLGMSDKPVWLLILAGSSAGKSALLDIVIKCGKWIHPIDTLTTNTFASGLRGGETETSLLHKANKGVLVFKDFTTLTSMNEEGLRDIMGQMRAIYDGSFNKKTGNNVDIDWKGKIGIIAGGTRAAAQKMRQFSEQGERFINYNIDVADSKEMAIRAMKNVKDMKSKEEGLRDIVAEFINYKLSSVSADELVVPEKIILKMIDIADFATQARSPVTMDKKDPTMVAFVGDREQPSRMAIQYANLALALMILCGEKELSEKNAQIIYKSALDSIPVERRMVLSVLAKYREGSTKAIAQKLHYSTYIVRGWCNQLDALKLLTRSSVNSKDVWYLNDNLKGLICEYDGIEQVDEVMIESETEDLEYGSAYIEEEQAYDNSLYKIDDDDFNSFVAPTQAPLIDIPDPTDTPEKE